MKKIYSAPQTSIDFIETEAILSVSESGENVKVSTSTEDYSGEVTILARQSFNLWDDEEQEE